MIYQQQAYGSRPLSNGLVVTVTPSSSEMSNSSVESSSSNNNNASFLASKLRKIKENLENSYVSSPIQATTNPHPQPSQTVAVNGNYSHVQTNRPEVFLTPNDSSTSSLSSMKRVGNNSDGVLELSNGYVTSSQQQHPLTYHPNNHRQSVPSHISNTTLGTTDSMSKYLQLNRYQTFDFELNNNKLSLDHILDQFDSPPLVSSQNNYYHPHQHLQQQPLQVNKSENNNFEMPAIPKTVKSNEPQKAQPYLNNMNERAIDFVIPVYREIVFNPYSNTNTNTTESMQKVTSAANQMVTFKNYSNQNGQVAKQQNGGNESFLKKAIYTENVSRQSSIRSLLSNISEASNPNKPVNTNKDPNSANNKIESPLFKKGAFFYSNGDLNFSANLNNDSKSNGTNAQNNLAKIKKNKANSNGSNNLLNFMPVTKKEIELLNDWDTFRPSPVKIINNTTHFSQVNNANFATSIQRPTTRLELRDDLENGSNLADSSTNFLRLGSSQSSNNIITNNINNINSNKNHNNKPTEYSDNVTVASSTSSGRYYQDEECESVLVTPTNEKEFFIMNNNNSNNEPIKVGNIEKHNSIGNETESVLSAFAVNNLTFENLGRQTPNTNNNERKYSKDNTNDMTFSEVFSENSYVINNSPVKNLNQSQNSEISFKQNTNHNSNTSKNSNDEVTIIQSPIAQECYHHHHHYSRPKNKSPTENSTSGNLIKTESNGASEKIKNYQRLSNSINNVFSNLLQELDKQKNKDFGQNLNKSLIIHSLYSNEAHDSSLMKNQMNKLNNSGNVFTKEVDQTINMNSPTRSYTHDTMRLNGEHLNSMTENDTSLIERYLTSEQAIAFKHSQVENILRKYQQKNLNLDSDYAIIEYILNQEGISKSTFKQLIREKFFNIDWSDNLLTKLHEIINQSSEKENKRIENLRNGNDEAVMEESVVIVKSDEDDSYDECANVENTFSTNLHLSKKLSKSQFNLDKESNVNPILRQGIRTNNSFHDFNSESQNSPSSSKSYRKIKDIKNATNFKKNKQSFGVLTTHDEAQMSTNEGFYNGHEIVESLNGHFKNENIKHEIQENLKKNLSDSFAKRRERKGSLPEINTSHMNSFYNFNYGSKNNSCLSFDPNLQYLSNSSAFLNKNDSTLISEQNYSKNNGTENKSYKNSNQRYSRKSAFVLEVLRTSMFRSKSLTDLNSSIVKYDNGHNMSNNNNMNNNSLISNKYNLSRSMNISNNNLNNSQSISLFNINSSNLFKTNFSINEK